MNVLLVSYHAPPQPSPRSIRVAQVGRALIGAGDQVELLTVDAGGEEERLKRRLEGARVLRVPAGPLERRSQARSGVVDSKAVDAPGGGGESASGGRPRAPRAPLRSLGGFRAFAEALLLPDRRVEWIPRALAASEELGRPDVVISFSPLFSGVVVGDRLARRFEVPHVIDYGDPWSHRPDYPHPGWRRVMDQALETRVAGRAAGIIVSTEPQVRAMRAAFPRLPEVVCVTNGYDPEDQAGPASMPGSSLRYLGSVYGPRLSLDAVGAALRRHSTWSGLEFYGVLAEEARPLQSDWLREHGRVDFAGSLRLMREAGALLVLGNRGGLQLPSKIFHYMASGRPILAVVEGPRDPILTLGLGDQLVWAPPDPDLILRALDVLVDRVGRRFTPPERWSWSRIGSRYREWLVDFMGRRGRGNPGV